MVELGAKATAWVNKLSGGQKQRLSVACALAGRPELLFLDEPTTGLDPQSRRQLWDVLERFRADGGTMLLTTHYMDEAHALCDRVGIMDHGRLIALGTPRELVASLGAEHVVEFALAGGRGAATSRCARCRASARSAHRDGHVALATSELHRTVPALLDALRELGVSLSLLTHPQRDPRGRLRVADRKAPARWLIGAAPRTR